MKWTPERFARLTEALMTTGVLRAYDLELLIQEHREDFARTTPTSRILEWLLGNTTLRELSVQSDLHSSPQIRYWAGSGLPSPYAVALSLARVPYLSHSTAAVLHNLSNGSDLIYVNQEQTPKPKSRGAITQAAVDRAFSAQQRTSRNVHRWQGGAAVIINGKFTSRLDVEPIEASDGTRVPVTGLERTLIDITVRPAYAGGPGEVLQAYQRARGRADTRRLDRRWRKWITSIPTIKR